MLYLIEGKLITVWASFDALAKNIILYLLSYLAAIIAVIYLYRLGTFLFRRFYVFLERNCTGHQI